MSSKILLLEDDKLFNETLEDYLSEEGYEIFCALDPYTAMDLSYEYKFDIYLFDINLPYESGFDLLGKLRASGDNTPAIFLTSRDDKSSLMQGFDIGADDYMKKPIDLDELSLRIKAVLSRQSREKIVMLGSYRLDVVARELSDSNGVIVDVSHKAVELLVLLIESSPRTASIEKIKDRLWSASSTASAGSLRVYISQLKKYFPNAIENIRGVGYKFDKKKAFS